MKTTSPVFSRKSAPAAPPVSDVIPSGRFATPPFVRWSKRARACWAGLALIVALQPALADAVGLWVGDIEITQVSHGPALEPAATPARWRILLHVDSGGTVRLLKDAIIATRSSTPTFQTAVLTKPALLTTLSLTRTNGAVLGQRLATTAYDFTDNDAHPDDSALELSGSLGPSQSCEGTLVLEKNHPTNPFRHKYHPDHAEGLRIVREIKLTFDSAITQTAGIDQLKANYEETLKGLATFDMTLSGAATLTRVATAPQLNQ